MLATFTFSFNIDIDIGDVDTETIEPFDPIDLDQPGASFQLDMLHDLLCQFQTEPDSYCPPYDPQRFFVAFLKDFSKDLQSHRAGEYNANWKCRQQVAKQALDFVVNEGGMFTYAEIVDHINDPSPELPDDYRKKVILTDKLLRAVSAPWKEIVEYFHKIRPFDAATKRKLLLLACYPDDSIFAEDHA